MGRQKKEYFPLSVKLSADINERMRRYCETTRQSKTAVVELGLTKVMDEYDEMMELVKKARAR